MWKNGYRLLLPLLALVGLVVMLAACAPKPPPADLILKRGKIVTLEPDFPIVDSLVARQGRIIAVGTVEDTTIFQGPETQVIDLQGMLAIPGFIESHAHLTGLGESRLILDLAPLQTWEEIVELVHQEAQKCPPGKWIIGRGWQQEKWTSTPEPSVQGFPVHDSLSAVSPENPVLLKHASGHATLANQLAMKKAGIGRDTANPDGGEIIRDGSGSPTGLFRETAADLVWEARERERFTLSEVEEEEELVRIIHLAAQTCLENGVTSFQDAGTSIQTIEVLTRMVEKNELPIRLYAMLNAPNQELREVLPKYRLVGFGNDHLTVRAIKRMMDGALGSGGAWLLEPYDDMPDQTGLPTISTESLRETARLAAASGFQLCTHAIGDRANRVTLDVYEEISKEFPSQGDLRWRVEHAQHLHPVDVPRFAGLGVIAAMQGIHCTSDAPWVPKRLGEKRAEEGAYVWRKLIDSGAVISNGTDAPVESVNPIPSFYASVSRRDRMGKAFFPSQTMSREEALQSYTLNAAYAAFEEGIKGSLKPGKLADITVLSKDILTIPEEEILSAEVRYTIVGGEVLFRHPNSDASFSR